MRQNLEEIPKLYKMSTKLYNKDKIVQYGQNWTIWIISDEFDTIEKLTDEKK